MDEIFFYWFLLFLKGLLWVVELFTDLIFGYTLTGGSRKEREEAKEYEKSAHLVNVRLKGRPIDLIPHSLWNFLYTHEKYVSPRFILENKHVTLFTAGKECVVFCVSDPEVDVYDTKKFPFVFYAHYYIVEKLVIIPVEHFNRLADELGDPKVDVSLVHMTTRCGSTLISQMMNRVPNTRSMSEPWALSRLAEMYNRRYYTWDAYRKLVQSYMRILCKVEPGTDLKRIVIKMNCLHSVMHEMLDEMFPQFNVVFNTRHPRPSIHSLMKVLHSVNDSIYAKTGLMWPYIANGLTFPYKEKYLAIGRNMNKWIRPMSYEESFVHVFTSSFASFQEAKHIYKHVIIYENLVADPDAEVEKIFRVMKVPLEYKQEAMKALETDSQAKKFGERGETIKLDDQVWKNVEDIFAQYYTGLRRDMTLEEFKDLVKLPAK